MNPGMEQSFPILDAPALPRSQTLDESLFGLTHQQLSETLKKFSAPAYRAAQLREALYRQWVEDVDAITTWPKDLREAVRSAGFRIGLPRITEVFRSVDGTERYLIAGFDGQTVETVWMPEGDDGESGDGSEAGDEETAQSPELRAQLSEPNSLSNCHPDRSRRVNGDKAEGPAFSSVSRHRDPVEAPAFSPGNKTQKAEGLQPRAFSEPSRKRATICVSSQIGCAVNCRFCLTAKLGIVRNLTAGEIAGQVVAVLKRHAVEFGRDRINLVFMGMGEPFLNYDAFMAAVRLLVEEVGIPESRMTVSTSGIVPGIERFAHEPVRPKLAISLNASNDAVREAVMPITRKWKTADVLDAVRQVPLRPRERVTFEYVLLGGVNDQLQHADEVVKLLRRANLPLKVNLIVWNPGPGTPYHMPAAEDVAAFRRRLIDREIPAFLRRPRGRDIYAACGQLKKTTSQEANP
jgi:23S rRNA (adenine2503-C2)-methyltransferase